MVASLLQSTPRSLKLADRVWSSRRFLQERRLKHGAHCRAQVSELRCLKLGVPAPTLRFVRIMSCLLANPEQKGFSSPKKGLALRPLLHVGRVSNEPLAQIICYTLPYSFLQVLRFEFHTGELANASKETKQLRMANGRYLCRSCTPSHLVHQRLRPAV